MSHLVMFPDRHVAVVSFQMYFLPLFPSLVKCHPVALVLEKADRPYPQN